jgi:hypothetical protein
VTAVALDGLLHSGPLMFLAYGALERRFPPSDPDGAPLPPRKRTLQSLKQALVSTVVVDSFFVLLLTCSSFLLEGHPPSSLPAALPRDFPAALRAGAGAALLLCPLDFAVFRFLGPRRRQLGMNLIDLVWTSVVSLGVHRNRFV